MLGKYENGILFFLCQQKKVMFFFGEWDHEDYDGDKEMTDIFSGDIT